MVLVPGIAPQLVLLGGGRAVADWISRTLSFDLLANSAAARPFGCLIVLAQDLARCVARAWLTRFRQEAPLTTADLVTSEHAAHLKNLAGVSADVVVCIAEIEIALANAYRWALATDILETSAWSLEVQDPHPAVWKDKRPDANR